MIDCGEAAGHRHKQGVTVFYNQRVQIRVALVTFNLSMQLNIAMSRFSCIHIFTTHLYN